MYPYVIITILLMVIGCVSNVIMLRGVLKKKNRLLVRMEVTCIAVIYQIMTALLVVITIQGLRQDSIFEIEIDSDILVKIHAICGLVSFLPQIAANIEQLILAGVPKKIIAISVSLTTIIMAIGTWLIYELTIYNQKHDTRCRQPFLVVTYFETAVYFAPLVVDYLTFVTSYMETKDMNPKPANPNGLFHASLIDFIFRIVYFFLGTNFSYFAGLIGSEEVLHFSLMTIWTISNIVFSWVLILSDMKDSIKLLRRKPTKVGPIYHQSVGPIYRQSNTPQADHFIYLNQLFNVQTA